MFFFDQPVKKLKFGLPSRGLVSLIVPGWDYAADNSAQTLLDRSGKGNSFIRGATTAVGADDPTLSATSLSYDGVDDITTPAGTQPYSATLIKSSNGLLGFAPGNLPTTSKRDAIVRVAYNRIPSISDWKKTIIGARRIGDALGVTGYTMNELVDCQIAEDLLTLEYMAGVITDVSRQAYWTALIESLSAGKNTVKWDNAGHPSVMVKVLKFNSTDVLTGATGVHPAFIVNGAEIDYFYASKYQSFFVGSGASLRAVTLRYRDPGNTITFDNSLLACRQKGTGWHLMTNAEWAAIALLCKARGFMPRGNNNYGKDAAVASEKAVPSFISSNLTARTATGTGPVAWSSDGSPFGVYDLNGNVYEWVGGLRTNGGEINVLENNNAADNTKLQTVGSAEWKALLQDGSAVAPGTADTLKYDFVSTPANGGAGKINITTQANASAFYSYNTFETEAISAGVTVPNLAKLLGIAPIDGSHGADGIYVNTNGERCAFRGGKWDDGSGAGVFVLNLFNTRSNAGGSLGFRSSFIP